MTPQSAEEEDPRLHCASSQTKRIGLLFGFERSFPNAVRLEINRRAVKEVEENCALRPRKPLRFICEDVKVDVMQAESNLCSYDVLLDRISHDIPCYQPFVKLAALQGTKVICDPFLRYTDDKFLQAALCSSLNIPHPRTFLLPSHSYNPCRTTQQSLSNLSFPLSFQHVFETLKFPFYLKPVASFGWNNVHLVRDEREFFRVYDATGESVMVAQERVEWSWYLRCLHVDGEVFPARWDPIKSPGERYGIVENDVPDDVVAACVKTTQTLCETMGYAINSVEFAVQFTEAASLQVSCHNPPSPTSTSPANFQTSPSPSAGVPTYPVPIYDASNNALLGQYTPFVIDMLNSVPDFDRDLSLGDEIFKWVVTKVADCLVRKATMPAHRSLANLGSSKWGSVSLKGVSPQTDDGEGTCTGDLGGKQLYAWSEEIGLQPHQMHALGQCYVSENSRRYSSDTGDTETTILPTHTRRFQ